VKCLSFGGWRRPILPRDPQGAARRQAQSAENAGSLDRHARIDQHGEQRRESQGRPQPVADAGHQPRPRFEADRHIGADTRGRSPQSWIGERNSIEPREQAQGRRRIGRTATDAGGDRQPLDQVKSARPRAWKCILESACRPQHEIAVLGVQPGGARAGKRQREGAERV